MGIFGAFILAVMVSLLFSPYKNRASIMPMLVLFFVLFFTGLAAQFWIVPFGPTWGGVAWFPILFSMFIFALLFSAPPHHRKVPVANASSEAAASVISIFIWIILLILAIAVIAGFSISNYFVSS
jgi:hypothetical protein